MEKKDIAILVVNAVVTIFTTAIVTRLSLNKGKLEISKEFKSKVKTAFIKYSQRVFFAFCILAPAYWVIKFVTSSKPIERIEVALLCWNIVNLTLWILIGVVEFFLFQRRKKTAHNQEDTPA